MNCPSSWFIFVFLFCDTEVNLKSRVLLGPRNRPFTDQTSMSADSNTPEFDQESSDQRALLSQLQLHPKIVPPSD